MATNLSFPSDFSVTFDVAEFDHSVRQHGIQFVHWRAQRCPVGMVDRFDERHPDGCNMGCSRGFVHTLAGKVTGLFLSSGKKNSYEDLGIWDGSTAMVTLPRTYDDSDEELQLCIFDRFYVDRGILVPQWGLYEAHITGRDKLDFPVEKVIDLIDNTGKRYGDGDFTIENGQIVWVPGRGPAYSAELNKGAIFSCRFLYRPYFILSRILHQVRLISVQNGLETTTVRAPQQFVLQRENISQNEDNNDKAPDPNSPRQVRGPRVNQFGPR